MKINFYSATSGKSKIVITLALVDEKIVSKSTKEFATMLKDILTSPGLPLGKTPVSAEKNPREFLASMPNTYLGSYFWAEVAK